MLQFHHPAGHQVNPTGQAFKSSSDRIEQTFGTAALCAVNTLLDKLIFSSRHGDMPRWQLAVDEIAAIANAPTSKGDIVLDQSSVGRLDGMGLQEPNQLKTALMQLHPWRKGPFQLGPIMIDTEWRSDWKWDRLNLDHDDLEGKRILDIGCGSGYHAWRMLGSGADLVIGIDPTLLFAMQFAAIWQFIQSSRFCFLPIGIERLPDELQQFDTIFSMGILYHRRSPIDHLQLIHDRLKPGGTLILETLVVEGEGKLLLPEQRYARMRNVWFIPSVDIIQTWLRRCRFSDLEVLDVSQTSTEEQRSTPWMQFESLRDCLDPDQPELTVEGYPAPVRVAIRATRP